MVSNDLVNDFDIIGLWSAKGVIKFLCRTDGGKYVLQKLQSQLSAGWKIRQFDEMETNEYFSDGSHRRIVIPGVDGYTDRSALAIYIADNGASDAQAAKSLTHELLHSFNDPVHSRGELLREENNVYFITEVWAADIGYPRNDAFYDSPRSSFPSYDRIGASIGRPPPGRPASAPSTNAYKDQLERIPKPPPPDVKKKVKRERVGTSGAFPTRPKDVLFDITKICPCPPE